MLIKKTGWVLFDTIQPTNMALLITDTKEMKEAQELFLAKQTTAHMCGYHYKISFLYDTDSIYTWTSFNKKCEVFDYKPVKTQKLLDYYGNQLETNPTHYIYDVKIPVTIKPDEAKEMLKHSGLMVFFLNGKSEYYNRNANTYTYSVQIVDTSNDIEVIKQKLKPYAFITEISKYDR
ncbi:MAG: hypothetical protein FWC39_06940 [Bacteroidetes bacterium]|nr:hypothetical protein [Bacteroidota bacterium]